MGCKHVYEAIRFAREQELADTARMLELANPQWRETFADALPGQYELMLLHAAAHHLQYGGPASEAVSLHALHDYLDDTMDCVCSHGGGPAICGTSRTGPEARHSHAPEHREGRLAATAPVSRRS